jgi:histidinol dehydrogenase
MGCPPRASLGKLPSSMLLRRIELSQPDYDHQVARLCDRSVSGAAEVERAVSEIIAKVRTRGDSAVRELTEALDGRAPGADGSYEIARSRWDQAAARLAPDLVKALKRAGDRIAAFHSRQIENGYVIDEPGLRLQLRVQPLARVGIYVPGGTARYPSSVLMNAIPARVAGVGELIMTTPGASDATLAAARIAGVDRVFEVGGAQAVAALAYGTESIPRVDKIVGPGNQWVAAAKRLVYGDVDIDSIAGPSEVMILADGAADARWVAADLLAQAEHDREARPVLVSTSAALVEAVEEELARQLPSLPRADIARESLKNHGVAVLARDLDHAVAVANRYAAEHLELQVAAADEVAERITAAGAIFVGPFTPEAAGDYLAGPNHVLPTGGAARFASPLGVYDFRKRVSILRYSRDALAEHADDIVRLAAVEGLDAHGRSAALRLASTDDPAPT